MPLIGTRGAASAQGFGEFAQSGPVNYIEDVFSTYLYTGTGVARTITNEIDLSGKGGMVWIKTRNSSSNYVISDTARGAANYLSSDSTSEQFNDSAKVSGFTSTGFSLGDNIVVNRSGGYNYVSWTFRKQPKFFDVVTYTGTGSVRTVAHNLASVPGCIIIKRTDTTSNWFVYHREMDLGVGAAGYSMNLNLTDTPSRTSNTLNDTNPTATVFTLGTNAMVNASGGTYVAYLFAHNAGGFGLSGADNVISCGITGSNGAGLGFEPQLVLYKDINNISDWYLFDNMRGVATGGTDAALFPNSSSAENSGTNWIDFNATGFSGGAAGRIYIAIRRGPMKTPTSGTSVYQGILTSANGYYTTNMVGDMAIDDISGNYAYWGSRLQGSPFLNSGTLDVENTSSTWWKWDSNTQVYQAVNSNANSINWTFRRAPGFMDVVCYAGTSSVRTVNHNLTVAPELIITKVRNPSTSQWYVYAAPLGATKFLVLNATDAQASFSALWNDTAPTSTVFTLGDNTGNNEINRNMVAYLFASCPGVSKVGSYTGNGTSQTINCGFAGGARWILIKRTDTTGSWWVWDTTRGIVAGNEEALPLNSNSPGASGDAIDPDSSGFIVNQVSNTNINVNGGSYIFLAIA